MPNGTTRPMAAASDNINFLQTFHETRALWVVPLLSTYFFQSQVQGKSKNVYFYKNMD